MISVAEAKLIIEENTSSLTPVRMPLLSAAGKILAEDIYASHDIPAFAQSSMDGYAFAFEDWEPQGKFIIEGEVEAGSNKSMTSPLEKQYGFSPARLFRVEQIPW